MTEIILGYDDISITAANFELFWRQHRCENREYYKQIYAGIKRTHDDPALIEYQLQAMGNDGGPGIAYDIPRATTRFQKLPGGKQRISLHVYQDKDQEDDFPYPIRSALLSEQDAEEAFTSFIAYLHEQGHVVELEPTPADDGTANLKVDDFEARQDRLNEVQPTWNRPIIRDLLTVAFNDADLTALCFDHFNSVYEKFTDGMTKNGKVQALLDYCFRHDQVDELLKLIQKHNPAQYSKFEDRLKTSS